MESGRRALLVSGTGICLGGKALFLPPPARAVGTIGGTGPKAVFKALIASKVNQNVTAHYGLLLQVKPRRI